MKKSESIKVIQVLIQNFEKHRDLINDLIIDLNDLIPSDSTANEIQTKSLKLIIKCREDIIKFGG